MQVNTFQAVLATDGTQSFVMFLYEDIQWSSATSIGLNAGDGVNFVTVPESLTVNGVLNLPNTSNVGLPGVYIYRVDQAPGKIIICIMFTCLQRYCSFDIAPVDCGALSPPLNGQIFIGNTTEGNVATYLCDSGFLLVNGSDSRVCGADGFWSGDQPTCEGNKVQFHIFIN